MQIIKPLLTNNTQPLGVISSLSKTDRLIFKKESDFLHSRRNFLTPIQTKSPLVTSSQFLLSREAEPSIQPVIGWDSWDNPDIDMKFPFIDFDPFQPIDSQENNNFDSPEIVTNNIPEIQSSFIENSIIYDTSPEINIQKQSKNTNKNQSKSQSKQTKKSTQKPKNKSTNKKSTKSSTPKNVVQTADDSNITIHPHQDIFIASNNYLSDEVNSSIPQTQNEFHIKSLIPDPLLSPAHLEENNSPTSQQDITLDNTTHNNFINKITPSTLSNVQEQPTLFKNIANEESQVFSELPSTLSSVEAPTSERITPPLQQKNKLGENINQLPENSPREFPLSNNVENIFTQPNNFIDNQPIVTETSEASPTPRQQDVEIIQSSQKTEIPDISVIPTPRQQDVEIIQPSQKTEIPDISVIPTPRQQDSEIIQPSQKTQIPDISVIPTPRQQDVEIIQSSQKAEIPDITVIPTPRQQDSEIIQSSQKTEIPDITVIPTPRQHVIQTDELSLEVDNQSITSLENVIHKQEILPIPTPPSTKQASKNQSNNFDEIKAIEPDLISDNSITNFDTGNFFIDDSEITSPNVENSAENHSSVILPPVLDVQKNPIVLEREVESSVTSKSLASVPVQLTPTSAYIENKFSFFSDSDSNEQLTNSESQSPLVVNVSDVPKNKISLQRDNTLENTNSESRENQLHLPLHEIDEASVVSNILPEIRDIEKVSKISPEIDEPSVVSNISPEIVEAPKINNTSPEIDEVAKVRDMSSNLGETSTIFRKIVDNEQIVESELLSAIANSENSEIETSQNQLNTPPQFTQNTTIENLPAPKGYATGGQVTNSHLENNQHIAPSDTVPAMLTPGEFVINTRDAQKNLPLLQHINSGGTPDNIIPSLQIPNAKESEKITSPHSTKVDSFTDTSLQLKSQESNSLIPSSLGLNAEKHQLSIVKSPQMNTIESKTTDAPIISPQYSSPPLIFRKTNSTTNTPYQRSDTPSQWSNLQELFNGNNNEDEFTNFFSSGEFNNPNSESESSQFFAKHQAAPRGFAEGGEVTAPASANTESVSETVENTSAKGEEENKDDTADLEALAREIYSRLRQRLEIERERHGDFIGRLSW
ncbi:hypothetical protein VF14_20685 [Nostoc linckia z18]|uniref:Uncharacterized protein n=1 Tax=Nostoc linckia z7 TaxID=1628745 RepID=A0ABX4KI97_NOSLI|nr:hypothetical protein [Nostoc linckia]PHK42129.1 hypothetical protein VF12_03900 [Nostoc linckia z15]PHK44080.1 hypothetical protein VF13_23855 [Nostoc linckia z16]PHJ58036.1 hypothetical protein VF02_28850 [Nostoc linckia z1]PHJ60157.1 hypothetical protein VF05_31025 [Nostoc linckia z3]PHJ65225.1 hypothetical protein VF03_28275 [Nostoc linckia z2]